ncbi:hypothetical protein CVT26_008621 [Gymnopilus dilepis]|uniref:Uncharacterized protein n=1 Tax=Gymnopilus dilepis TaxID=231916 RepID=A0A409XXU4_9AGAR|nr:hypothetical protein CVT26_008621 [Gymnopilus dilepis]
MPALQHLGFVGYDDILLVDDLTSFYTRSSCALQCLAIDEADFEQGDLADFIPLLSSLRELRLRFRTSGSQRHKYPDRSHVKQFPSVPISLASCHGEPLLPLLEVFCWEGRAAYPWGTIPGLITPICPQSGQHRRPLKSVKIKCYYGDRYPFIEEGVVQQLLAISDVKLDLTVSTGRFEGGYHAVDWLKASVERPAEDPTFTL